MPAAVVVALAILAANLDVEGGATIEARQGSAPFGVLDPPHAASVAVVTPEGGALVTGPSGHLKLRYFPALTSAHIDGAGGERLYVLHQADLTAMLVTDRRASWTLRLSGTTGDTDYAALTQLLGRTQSQLPAVTGLTMATAVLTSILALDRRTELETSVDLLHRAPLGQSPASPESNLSFPNCPPAPPLPDRLLPPPRPATQVAPPGVQPPAPALMPPPVVSLRPPLDPNATQQPFPVQDQITLTPSLIHTVTRQDTVDLRAGLGSLWLSTGLNMLRVAPHVGWQHAFARESRIRAGVGLVYTEVARLPRGCSAAEQPLPERTLKPVADLGVSTVLVQHHRLLLIGSVTAAALWYFDPVIGRAGSLGISTIQIAATMPPEWSVRLDASFSTSLSRRPITGDPDETVFMAALPIRYWKSPDVYLELGGRWADRAPHLAAEGFRFHRREIWIYAAVGGTFGTARMSPLNANPATTASISPGDAASGTAPPGTAPASTAAEDLAAPDTIEPPQTELP
ncbi:MAG: hypothetical protein ABIS92_03055 [Polyangia bacterium]